MNRPLGPGDRIPDFELQDQDGQPVRLAALLGGGPVVIFFYPKDDTAGCTREVCSFRDVHAEFAEAGARVVGISGDGVESHRRFSGKHKLNYPLLADAGDVVRDEIFQVRRSMLGLIAGRVTYVVDAQGVIRHVIDSLLQTQRHVDEALQVVRQLTGGSPAGAVRAAS